MKLLSSSMRLILQVVLILLCVIFIENNAIGQFKEIFVPMHPQRTNNWCWAASVEMIKKFHEPADNFASRQCKIVNRYLKISANDNAAESCASCICRSNCPNDGVRLEYSLPSTSTIGATWKPDYFELLLESYGYRSNQEVNEMNNAFSWDFIKNQIDICRPFIIVIEPEPIRLIEGGGTQRTLATLPPSDHTVVVKGYFQTTNGSNTLKYLITNDPWNPCAGHISLFPFDVFNIPTLYNIGNNYIINKVSTMIHSIHPNNAAVQSKNCESCESLEEAYQGNPVFTTNINESTASPQEEDTNILMLLVNNEKSIAGFTDNYLTETSYNKFVNMENNFDAEVDYFSYESLVGKENVKSLEEAVIPNNEVFEVVNFGTSPQIVSTFQKIAKTYALRKITTYTSLKNVVKLRSGGDEILLSNIPRYNGIPYKLIKYPLFQYEFFSFEIDNVNYMIPVEDYDELELKKEQAYKVDSILRIIQKKTRQYSKGRPYTRGCRICRIGKVDIEVMYTDEQN